jgi:hypothetical protein
MSVPYLWNCQNLTLKFPQSTIAEDSASVNRPTLKRKTGRPKGSKDGPRAPDAPPRGRPSKKVPTLAATLAQAPSAPPPEAENRNLFSLSF